MLDPTAMTDDQLATALYIGDQLLDKLVDDGDSPLWDERQALLAEVERRGLALR
jgi:hypothetical protein